MKVTGLEVKSRQKLISRADNEYTVSIYVHKIRIRVAGIMIIRRGAGQAVSN